MRGRTRWCFQFFWALHIDRIIIWSVFPCSKWRWWTQTRHNFLCWAFLRFPRQSQWFFIGYTIATGINIILGNIFSSTKRRQFFVINRIFNWKSTRSKAFLAHNIMLITIHTDVFFPWGFPFRIYREFFNLPWFHTFKVMFCQFLGPLLVNLLNLAACDVKPSLIKEAILFSPHNIWSIFTVIHCQANLNFNQP